MTLRAPNAFVPPSAQQLRSYIDDHPPQQAPRLRPWMFVVGLASLILLASAAGSPWAWALPWGAVFGVVVFLSVRAQRIRWLESQVVRVQEMTLLRHWPQSLRLAWKLLPAAQRLPNLHGRLIAFMAHTLDEVKAYDAALVAYDYLLRHLPAAHPTALQLRTQRALVLLADDRLADADDALRRLRGSLADLPPNPTTAAYRIALLLQAVKTFHWDDACAITEDDLIANLRPLGVDAGYGYALAALAHWQRDALGESPAADAPPSSAVRTWFERATLLTPPSALVHRIPELQPLVEALRTADNRPGTGAEPAP